MGKNIKNSINDVARLAGVGRGTVSRVLNNHIHVSEKTKKKVLKAVKHLDYRINQVAQSLKSQRTYMIGIIVSNFHGYVYPMVVAGAENAARESNYQIVICGSEVSSEGEPIHSPILSKQNVEGLLIIYHGTLNDSFKIINELPKELPIVTTGYRPRLTDLMSFRVETSSFDCEIAKYLLELGHQQIAVITGPKYAYDAYYRTKRFKNTMKARGQKVDEDLIAEGNWWTESGYKATVELLDSGKNFTAVYAQNDWMALGSIKALRDSKFKIPDDISVVGYNDLPFVRYLDPPLTTVSYPAYELGKICIKKLIQRIELGRPVGLTQEEKLLLRPHLVERESCRLIK